MKSRIILISICLLFITNAFSQETYYYIKGEKHYLTNISTKRILVGFVDELSIFEKNETVEKTNDKFRFDIINELNSDKQQSSNDRYIINLSDYSKEKDVIKLVKILQDDKNVKYANYFYYQGQGEVMDSYTDEVIVKLKPNVSKDDLVLLSEKFNFDIVEKKTHRNEVYVIRVRSETKIDAARLSCILWETSMFLFSTPSGITILKQFSINTNNPIYEVNDPKYGLQWGLPYMKVDKAWNFTTGYEFVSVAVLDNGVDLSHPDLIQNLLDGYDCFNEGLAGGHAPDNHHGTQCAGCFGAKGNNNEGVAGVSFDCSIIPVRAVTNIDDKGGILVDWTAVADGITWSAFSSVANVISISFGNYTGIGGIGSDDFEDALNDVHIYGRGGLGIPIIVASGNDTHYENNDPYDHFVCYPANLDNTISVGNITQQSQREETSCYINGKVHLVAPGKDIETTDIGGGYTNGSGTSYSAPYVAGIFALMFSLDPTLSYEEAKELLLTNCIKPDGYVYDNFDNYGNWNNEIGHGYPDVEAIMEEISSGTGNLNISISHTQNQDNPKKFSFTATCNNGGANTTYFWTINTIEGDLSEACHYTEEGCVSTSSNPTNEITFPDYGYYYINVFVYDEDAKNRRTHTIYY